MPAMIVWPVSSSVLTRKVGSSSASFCSAMPSLSWSDLVFGSIATRMTGSGKTIVSSSDLVVLEAERVARAGELEADGRADLAGGDAVALLTGVGVHLQDAADALLLALGHVDDLGAGADLARVDAEERELADVRVGHRP